jgi:hypothetical protein
MAHESFEDTEAAEIINRHFVPVKVDKEERPDIDSAYMNVCVALTGSGGWPMTVVMDSSGKPFFAGTYFPKRTRYGMTGLIELLNAINEQWHTNKERLIDSAEKITAHINTKRKISSKNIDSNQLIEQGQTYFKSLFDPRFGGFGKVPKFPSPHNLLFLMQTYREFNSRDSLDLVETTLMSMAKGGIFDHIGFGFSRYSTDEKWLAPHFEKMLYDNALLITAYTDAYEITQNPVYKSIAEKTILYIEREMTHPDGGFYSAQDADSDGVEGKYYVFMPDEIKTVLGEADGMLFCKHYDITEAGNFEGKSIPNQINKTEFDDTLAHLLPKLYEYRKTRTALHKDDKILTSWNALMIAALADAYRVFGDLKYLKSAKKAVDFIELNLCGEQENISRVYTSFRDNKRTETGFFDDYAFYIYALLKLYNVTGETQYLKRAKSLTDTVTMDFFDNNYGGFFLTAKNSEVLFSRPKEVFDGAIPSGNSVMTMNLFIFNFMTGEYGNILNKQVDFMSSETAEMPGGSAFFLYTLLKMEFAERKASDFICDKNGCRQINVDISH